MLRDDRQRSTPCVALRLLALRLFALLHERLQSPLVPRKWAACDGAARAFCTSRLCIAHERAGRPLCRPQNEWAGAAPFSPPSPPRPRTVGSECAASPCHRSGTRSGQPGAPRSVVRTTIVAMLRTGGTKAPQAAGGCAPCLPESSPRQPLATPWRSRNALCTPHTSAL